MARICPGGVAGVTIRVASRPAAAAAARYSSASPAGRSGMIVPLNPAAASSPQYRAMPR